MRRVVVDTNVLLSNPDAINGFPDAEVLLPDTVLTEIDKLKTARVDAELRFKGREISRLLFELSEQGPLQDGVSLPNGSRLRVVTVPADEPLPEGLNLRSADDRILAVALDGQAEDSDGLTLVTNDLNMLLKAQAYGVEVERVETADSFTRRFIVRPFQRYRVPLTILAVAMAVFAAIIYLVAYSPFAASRPPSVSSLPREFLDQLTVEQQQALGYLFRLDENPKDVETQRSLAVLYDQMSEQDVTYLPYAIKHYEALLQLDPGDADARTDLASAYYRSGHPDQAIKEVTTVLQQNPDHVNANFNLGIFYLASQPPEFQKAANQFEKVIRLTEGSRNVLLVDALGRARNMLEETLKQAQAAGQTVDLGEGAL